MKRIVSVITIACCYTALFELQSAQMLHDLEQALNTLRPKSIPEPWTLIHDGESFTFLNLKPDPESITAHELIQRMSNRKDQIKEQNVTDFDRFNTFADQYLDCARVMAYAIVHNQDAFSHLTKNIKNAAQIVAETVKALGQKNLSNAIQQFQNSRSGPLRIIKAENATSLDLQKIIQNIRFWLIATCHRLNETEADFQEIQKNIQSSKVNLIIAIKNAPDGAPRDPSALKTFEDIIESFAHFCRALPKKFDPNAQNINSKTFDHRFSEHFQTLCTLLSETFKDLVDQQLISNASPLTTEDLDEQTFLYTILADQTAYDAKTKKVDLTPAKLWELATKYNALQDAAL